MNVTEENIKGFNEYTMTSSMKLSSTLDDVCFHHHSDYYKCVIIKLNPSPIGQW